MLSSAPALSSTRWQMQAVHRHFVDSIALYSSQLFNHLLTLCLCIRTYVHVLPSRIVVHASIIETKWAMMEEDHAMKELISLEFRIKDMKLTGEFSEKQLRRLLLKDDVVVRNRRRRDREGMLQEERRGQELNFLWREQRREAEERMLMAIEDEHTRDYEDELRFADDDDETASTVSGMSEDTDSDDDDIELMDEEIRQILKYEASGSYLRIPMPEFYRTMSIPKPVVPFLALLAVNAKKQIASPGKPRPNDNASLAESSLASVSEFTAFSPNGSVDGGGEGPALGEVLEGDDDNGEENAAGGGNANTAEADLDARTKAMKLHDNDPDPADLVIPQREPWTVALRRGETVRYEFVVKASEDLADRSRAEVSNAIQLRDQARRVREEKRVARRQARRKARRKLRELRKKGITDAMASVVDLYQHSSDPDELAALLAEFSAESGKQAPATTEAAEALNAGDEAANPQQGDETTALESARPEEPQMLADQLGLDDAAISAAQEYMALTEQLEEDRRRREKLIAKNAWKDRMKRKREKLGIKETELIAPPKPKWAVPELDRYSLDLEARTKRVSGKAAYAELAAMIAEEDNNIAHRAATIAEYNSQRLRTRVTLRTRESRKLRAIADKAKRRVDWSRKKLQECIQAHLDQVARTREAQQEYRGVMLECEYTDTTVLHGQSQRFKTDILYARLHLYYFRSLAEEVVAKAEAAAAERRMHRLTEVIMANTEEARRKENAVRDLKRKLNRENMLRTRRSELGTKLFPKARWKCLRATFSALCEYWRWHRGVRGAFETSYGIYKQGMDISRYARETREAEERKQHHVVYDDKCGSVAEAFSFDAATGQPIKSNTQHQRHQTPAWAVRFGVGQEAELGDVAAAKPSALMAARRRRVTCRQCHEQFASANNYDRACVFHPGKFEKACPKSCTKFTATCVRHYRLRYSCCDATGEGAKGCTYSWHLPPLNDAELRANVEVAREAAEKQAAEDSAARTEVIAAQRAMVDVKMKELDAIAEKNAELRKIAELHQYLKKG